MRKETLKEKAAWIRGASCAVAEIIRTHGEEVVAKDCLHVAGRVEDITKYADEYDLETLRAANLIPANAPAMASADTKTPTKETTL